jgi:hypothetical protein
MKTLKFYSETTYFLYWNSHRQLTTNNEDLIKLFILNAKDRGDDISKYHISSNVAPGYDVNQFLSGVKLPMCWQTN